MSDLSIVFGTYNRLELLKACLAAIKPAAVGLTYEIIIVDGGSTDGTLEYLKKQDVKLIQQGKLLGPVAAYNEGFKAARGKYVAYINDDLELAPDTLSAACALLNRDVGIGIVSIPYCNPGSGPSQPTTTVGSQRYPFASFGVVRRFLGERAGWFDGFYHYYGDCYLSVKVQKMGYTLVWLPGHVAKHHNADNTLRGEKRWNVKNAKQRAREDGQRWDEMWKEKSNG